MKPKLWPMLSMARCAGPVAALVVALLQWLASTTIAEAQVQVAVEGGVAAPAKSEPRLGTDFVRLLYDDKDADELLAMQTAIVRYQLAPGSKAKTYPGAKVDLVAAVHVGDAAYYRALNRRFQKYDALLYELVAPEGTVVERGRGTSNAHPLGALQNGMKSMLALEHQLEKVDYTKPNFVHADMSPEQFLNAMTNRNESFMQMYMRLLGHSMALQSDKGAKGESPEVELMAALFAPDRPRRLKQALAKQLADTESLLADFGGEQGSMLITERNKAALNVLRDQLNAGKKDLAIFYGAGHLADMDERLREDFGFEPVGITWLTAWDLAAK